MFSIDFRAPEHMVQQIMQVSGRAGRGDKPGKVLIQTWHPEHIVFDALKQNNYLTFVDKAMFERQSAQLPPFVNAVLLRGEATRRQTVQDFMNQAYNAGKQLGRPLQLVISLPVVALMERKSGR